MTDFLPGFTSQTDERAIDALPVQGTIPDWLSGTLIRNGPGRWEVGSASYRHWFDGLAMLHAFSFVDGSVSYRSRFLRTPQYAADTAEGKIHYRGFAVDPCRSIFARFMALFTDKPGLNANVNVTRAADAFIAMTETPIPVRFDPRTLETLGVFAFEGEPIAGQVTTAHPHYDFARAIGINYLTHLSRRTVYNLYALHGARRRLIARLPTERASYMHSFSVSERYIILSEYPYRLPSALDLLLSGRPFIENYRWQPDQPTIFTVIDKDTGAVAARAEGEPCFCFHHVNAFEENGTVIVDLIAYPDPAIIRTLLLDNLRAEDGAISVGTLQRCRIPLAGGRVTYERIASDSLELPRLNYRQVNGRPYRYVYGAGIAPETREFLNQIVKIDVTTGRSIVWREARCYPSEPVFVARPGATAEDDGVVLTVVLDGGAGHSFLLVQDARTFDEIGRAVVPGVIPFGFHGMYAP